MSDGECVLVDFVWFDIHFLFSIGYYMTMATLRGTIYFLTFFLFTSSLLTLLYLYNKQFTPTKNNNHETIALPFISSNNR
jgi:hypothetical protein